MSPPAPPPLPLPTHPLSPPTDPRVSTLLHILTTVPLLSLDAALSSASIPPLPSLVDAVLLHSLSNPPAAVRFFRWSALAAPHASSSWNLIVHLLASNSLFEAAWDAIRSMRDEPSGPLSSSTFISLIRSYLSQNRLKDALMTFDVMPRYGVKPDVRVLNALVSALPPSVAADFVEKAKAEVSPDAETFTCLIDGWGKEGDLAKVKSTFGEMVVRLGWDKGNSEVHDVFLRTLVKAGEAVEAIKFLKVMESKGCFPGTEFFADALEVFVREKDLANAVKVWDVMVGGGVVPDVDMYNRMIGLYSRHYEFYAAWRLLDEMPLQGAFPDSLTYNCIFECLIENKRVREAVRFFNEMRKNEWLPTPANCVSSIRMFFDQFDPESAVEVWRFVLEEQVASIEECANEFLVGLKELGRMAEVRRYAEDMIDMGGIELLPTTMVKLKSGFRKAGKSDVYRQLERKWKTR